SSTSPNRCGAAPARRVHDSALGSWRSRSVISGVDENNLEILGVLGSGGFSIVHRARDTASGCEFALKSLKPEARSDKHSELLRREFTVHSKLRHPNIVRAHDLIVHPDVGLALLLELVSGSDFRQLRCVTDDAVRVDAIVQLCRALNYLHARGLVHGDLK